MRRLSTRCREVDDYEWRPTFLPLMKTTPLASDVLNAPSSKFYKTYAEKVAALDQPKRALRGIRDERRIAAYKQAIDEVVMGASGHALGRVSFTRVLRFLQQHGIASLGCDTAVFETGTGVLPLLCAAAGASTVDGAQQRLPCNIAARSDASCGTSIRAERCARPCCCSDSRRQRAHQQRGRHQHQVHVRRAARCRCLHAGHSHRDWCGLGMFIHPSRVLTRNDFYSQTSSTTRFSACA